MIVNAGGLVTHRISGPPGWVLRGGGIVASLDINFVTNQAWNSPSAVSIASLLTCTRASTGYYTDASGNLTSVAANTLRTGNNGLLVEEARTNLFLRSQQFDDAAWSKNELTVAADAIAAPDGTTTADKATPSTNSALHYAVVASNLSVTALTTYTFSVYAKSNGYRWLAVDLAWPGNTDNPCYFDLVGGVVGSAAGGMTTSIQALANGWYRCIATLTTAAGQTNMGPLLVVTTADGAIFTSYPGDGASGQYWWGAQLEAGAFATSYIPTTTASVTRAADAVSQSPLGSWYSTTTGSVYLQAQKEALGVTNTNAWSISDTTLANLISLGDNVGNINFTTTAASVGGANINKVITDGILYKAAVAWAQNDFAESVNGAAAGTGNSGNIPVVTTLFLGAEARGNQGFFDGYIKRFAYWNSRLSNAALQALAT